MKFYEAGWPAAIARVNARIGTDEKTLNGQTTPEPESINEHPEVIAVRKRCEAIVGACVATGMLEHASAYFDDPRDLDEILDEIRAAHLATDFASHLGVKSEFRMKVN